MRSSVALLLMLVLIGCSRNPGNNNPPKNENEGEEISNNPFTAMNQLSKMAEKMAETQKEIAAMKPVDPVHFDKLLPLLPAAPAGFEAEEPKGETTEAGEFKYSQAERRYKKDDKIIDVKIQDAAHIPLFYAWLSVAAMMKKETTEGYEKGLTIDGDPAFERFTKSNQHGELTVLVAKRHIIEIRTDGVPSEMMRTVLSSIDRKALAALK